MRKTLLLLLFLLHWMMEKLIVEKKFREALDLVVKEIEEDPESKNDLKELFTFLLNTYW